MHSDKDTRQKRFFQTYRSETKTLAICRDLQSIQRPSFVCTFVNARVRIRKSDRRLPLQFCVAFEPDGGSPDMAIISQPEEPKISARELVLFNRSYIPVVNRIGNVNLGGANIFASQKGSTGLAIDFSDDCDAIDVAMHLTQALGDFNTLAPYGEGQFLRFGGRWICGYSITVTDRMSSEEWERAVQECNMMVECFSDRQSFGDTQGGVPILTSGVLMSIDPSYGDTTEGTGGDDIPNNVTVIGTGGMG